MSDYECDLTPEEERITEVEEIEHEEENMKQIGVAYDATKLAVIVAIKEIRLRSLGNVKSVDAPLDENNWAIWSKRIIPILKVSKVYNYVTGTIKRQNLAIDLDSIQNWGTNDELAKLMILQNVSNEQLQHIDQSQTSANVWKSLTALHQSRGFHTALTYMRTLYHMTLAENENIPDYINKMKGLVDLINSMKSPFKISDEQFAGVLAQSLPTDWKPFVDKLFPTDIITDHAPKLNIIHFQRQIKDEYFRKIGQSSDEALITAQAPHQSNMAYAKPNTFGKRNWTGTLKALFCNCCKRKNHATD